MPLRANYQTTGSLFLIFIAGISYISLAIDRSNSMLLGVTYFSIFLAYVGISRLGIPNNPTLTLGILARIALFFTLPSLSDDFYRFLWDGQLSIAGLSPYTSKPSEMLGAGAYFTQEQLELINSPDYYSIYPPLNQFIFWLSVLIDGSPLLSVNIIRGFILIADLVSFILLSKISPKISSWFFLNPLLILEGVGNLHFEPIVITFILLTISLISKKKLQWTGMTIGAAIGTKLIPLILVPALIWKFRWKAGIIIGILAALVTVITMFPLLAEIFQSGFTDSLKLYFQSFEFNASIYYLIREIGFYIKGYNIIQTLGPRLAYVSSLLILFYAVLGSHQNWSIPKTWLFTLTSYLFLSTTVHPWYILPLIPLGLLAGYWYPIIWSLLIFATYFGYSSEDYEIPTSWIFFEYLVLWIIILFELSNERKIKHTISN